MKEIKLTHGKVALVDDADFEWLNQWKWNAFKGLNTFYARRPVYKISEGRKFRTTSYMHRDILELSDSKILCDHIDRNGLNNQRVNLRVASASENSSNRKKYKNSYSKYIGVSWRKNIKSWRVTIEKMGVSKTIGYYKNEEEAAIAYDMAAKRIHGDFANLNFK